MSHPPRLDIDYPGDDEIVGSRHYAIRVGPAEPMVEVEVSIDRGPWNPCRHACGYWWFDWAGYGPGEHQIAARGTARDGRSANSTFRRFRVEFRGK